MKPFLKQALMAALALCLPACMHVEFFHPDVEGTYHLGADRPFWSYEGEVHHVQLATAVTPVAQENGSWCWAAASEMLLQSQGITLHQADVVRRAYGDTREAGGKSPLMVQEALTDTFHADDGKKVKLEAARADGFPHNGLELLASIEDDRPFIVDIGYYKSDARGKRTDAYAAHSLLVYGLTYRREGNEVKILSLDTIDPSFGMIRQTVPAYDAHQKLDSSLFDTIQGTLGVYRR